MMKKSWRVEVAESDWWWSNNEEIWNDDDDSDY